MEVDNEEIKEDLRKHLQPIVEPYFENEDTDFYSGLPSSEVALAHDPYNLQNIFNIEPVFGSLLPFEYLMANVGFNPPPNVRVKAVVLCNVEGGETERLLLKGASAKVRFKFDKDKIDFKRKVGTKKNL